ncbi:Protein of unknown function [Lactobacillus helveticus CIRM-BIA 953]|uniref:Uncharacterized protein n=1 Tax=Lactobacillus helveticus CIRM-BIA 953 TaxID=1226335 RepID=U4QM55_LACHE|nr:Protein of unknown function [Lactobacillus helveticus CIRM-BIA 953]
MMVPKTIALPLGYNPIFKPFYLIGSI